MNDESVEISGSDQKDSTGDATKSNFYPRLLLAVILAVIVVAIIILFPSTKVAPVVVSGAEVAKQTLNFLDGALRDDGSWVLLYSCEQFLEEKCREAVPDGPAHTGQAILAYYYLAEAEDDPSFRQKADKAMSYVLSQCELNTDHCQWNFFPLYRYYLETGEEVYRESMLKVSGSFLSEEDVYDFTDLNMGVKLWMLFEVTGDDVYADRLNEMALRVLEERNSPETKDTVIYTEGEYSVKTRDMQRIWSVYIPAYRVTGDERFLHEVETFFKESNIVDHLELYTFERGGIAISKGLEALLDLIDLKVGNSDLDQYTKQAQAMGELILRRWDTPDHQIFNGDYGFIVGENFTSSNKSPLNTGWLVQLYIRMWDETFELKPLEKLGNL